MRVFLSAVPLGGRASHLITLVTIGIQSSISLILLIVSVFGIQPTLSVLIRISPYVTPWSVLIGIIYLTLCLMIGTFVNRISSVVYHMFRPRFIFPAFIREKAHAELGRDIRVEFALKEGLFSVFLDEITERIHLLHSSVFNLVLIIFSSALLTLTHCAGASCATLGAGIIGLGLFAFVAGLLVLESQQIAYEAREQQAKRELDKTQSD